MSNPRPDIFVFIGDCLRASDADSETLPFVHDQFDISFNWCFSPGTWTLPSHASLYSGESPVDHGVARRGQVINREHAELGGAAQTHGYETALFSENPTFSSKTGFDYNIDYVDDSIDLKLFRTQFAALNHADDVGLSSMISVAKGLLESRNQLRNLINTTYGVYSHLSEQSSTDNPHNGSRVVSHLASFTRQKMPPVCCFTNLLDTHNPHHAPPVRGADCLGLDVSPDERRALAAANDVRLYLLEERSEPPTVTREYFDEWESVFKRQHEVYRAQVREVDELVRDWFEAVTSQRTDEALVIVTGDHGQLFGEEQMLGHHTSLHPHGVHVPLFIQVPDTWTDMGSGITTVDSPVSLTGLSKALRDVTTGKIDSSSEFVQSINHEFPVEIAVDGPTWDMNALHGTYEDDVIEKFKLKKIGVIDDSDKMTVYESKWGTSEITRRDYSYHADNRTLVSEETVGSDSAGLSNRRRDWLTSDAEVDVSVRTSKRLRDLGYL